MGRLLACGLATLDVVQRVDAVPGPNDKIVARGLLVESGGPAANAAVTATALGVPTRLLTRVGGSPLGRLVAADLAARGVEVLDLGGPDDAPALSTVLVTVGTGERAVVSVNATAAPGRAPDAAEVAAALAGVSAVLVDGHHLDLAVAVAAAARVRGVPVLLDGGSWKPGLADLLAHVDVAVVSADFAVPADARPSGDGDVLADVASFGPRVVARSAGAGPIEVLTRAGRAGVPVPAVAVVDTLGAGDVLHGALAAWLATRGMDGGTAGAFADRAPTPGLAFAAEVASASCTAEGARGWLAGDPGRWRDRLLAPVLLEGRDRGDT